MTTTAQCRRTTTLLSSHIWHWCAVHSRRCLARLRSETYSLHSITFSLLRPSKWWSRRLSVWRRHYVLRRDLKSTCCSWVTDSRWTSRYRSRRCLSRGSPLLIWLWVVWWMQKKSRSIRRQGPKRLRPSQTTWSLGGVKKQSQLTFKQMRRPLNELL